jgi:hypothetical protein
LEFLRVRKILDDYWYPNSLCNLIQLSIGWPFLRYLLKTFESNKRDVILHKFHSLKINSICIVSRGHFHHITSPNQNISNFLIFLDSVNNIIFFPICRMKTQKFSFSKKRVYSWCEIIWIDMNNIISLIFSLEWSLKWKTLMRQLIWTWKDELFLWFQYVPFPLNNWQQISALLFSYQKKIDENCNYHGPYQSQY